MKIINVVGARPNFMKIAPIISEMKKYKEIESLLVHTGQHYDENMSRSFFDDLEIPRPDINLNVGSASHAIQTADIMIEFEKVCFKEKPDYVLVVGDVNSTIACALDAKKLGIKVIHIEAGLRSFDMKMPEEINRILTDQIADLLFITEEDAKVNLSNEGISPKKIHFVGNVMIDILIQNLRKCKKSNILKALALKEKEYSLLTLHRPSNVDSKEKLQKILQTLNEISEKIPIVFPIHPRTENMVQKFGLSEKIKCIKTIPPLGYLDFMRLIVGSKFVLTDSGGIQEETTYLKIPCLTMRENTERPITEFVGSNVIVGTDADKILSNVRMILSGNFKNSKIPKFWDGKASERIVKTILDDF
ncbi:MAG: UDP-N-acetylglucosamine 2-epimerase (non-hydrolyzing) [Candidatus Cloacimonetes bacterium]|nr:UDP-N-acetylglucosamine 2-epimerase (non-hydrolyzing) [Candidatus Cloacimonadota bacterium]